VAEYGPETGECLVFTYKEGLLSRVAHDLKLRFERFKVTVDDETRAIDACFDCNSLRVVSAMKGGEPDGQALSAADKKKIEDAARKDVLKSKRYPRATFVAEDVTEDGDGFVIRGELTLVGRTVGVLVHVAREGGRLVASARLNQPDFGIKPFSAMLGALKIQPGVDVRVSLPVA